MTASFGQNQDDGDAQATSKNDSDEEDGNKTPQAHASDSEGGGQEEDEEQKASNGTSSYTEEEDDEQQQEQHSEGEEEEEEDQYNSEQFHSDDGTDNQQRQEAQPDEGRREGAREEHKLNVIEPVEDDGQTSHTPQQFESQILVVEDLENENTIHRGFQRDASPAHHPRAYSSFLLSPQSSSIQRLNENHARGESAQGMRLQVPQSVQVRPMTVASASQYNENSMMDIESQRALQGKDNNIFSLNISQNLSRSEQQFGSQSQISMRPENGKIDDAYAVQVVIDGVQQTAVLADFSDSNRRRVKVYTEAQIEEIVTRNRDRSDGKNNNNNNNEDDEYDEEQAAFYASQDLKLVEVREGVIGSARGCAIQIDKYLDKTHEVHAQHAILRRYEYVHKSDTQRKDRLVAWTLCRYRTTRGAARPSCYVQMRDAQMKNERFQLESRMQFCVGYTKFEARVCEQ